MLLQLEYMPWVQVIADIIGIILVFLKPFVTPIGVWMTGWITVATEILQQNFGESLTFYLIIGIVLVVSAVIINIIWPGDRPGTIFSKGVKKEGKLEKDLEEPEETEVIDDVRRCKDCGNPIGDQDICPLCGARN
ncbi:MAG: hypothetical protein ACFFB0_05045 [Promethearchaeota archaeon]